MKAGCPCVNCLPFRRGLCKNIRSSLPPVTSDPLPSGTSDRSSCGSVLSLESLSAVSSMISEGLDGQETSDSVDSLFSDNMTTNPCEAVLQPFSPLPVFSWGMLMGAPSVTI